MLFFKKKKFSLYDLHQAIKTNDLKDVNLMIKQNKGKYLYDDIDVFKEALQHKQYVVASKMIRYGVKANKKEYFDYFLEKQDLNSVLFLLNLGQTEISDKSLRLLFSYGLNSIEILRLLKRNGCKFNKKDLFDALLFSKNLTFEILNFLHSEFMFFITDVEDMYKLLDIALEKNVSVNCMYFIGTSLCFNDRELKYFLVIEYLKKKVKLYPRCHEYIKKLKEGD